MTAEHEFLRQKSATAEIALPDKLAKIKKADEFPTVKYKWNSNETRFTLIGNSTGSIVDDEAIRLFSVLVRYTDSGWEVLSLLLSLSDHNEWVSKQAKSRPQNGSMFIFDRSKVRDYRKDGYTWKKRRSGNTIREDHTRLKVDKVECLSVLYTHSALVPTFHRRCYWLLQNPDIVLVHYLNLVEECIKPITVSVYAPPESNDDISKQLEAICKYRPELPITVGHQTMIDKRLPVSDDILSILPLQSHGQEGKLATLKDLEATGLKLDAGVPSDCKPDVTVSEESPLGSPSSSEDSEKASKNERRPRRNKAVYKISILPNTKLQTSTGKLRVKFIKVTQDEQGRLTVSGHREGSPSLEQDDSSLEGNDSGTTDDVNQSTCVSALNGHDSQLLISSPMDLLHNQSQGDLASLSVVPMVTQPVTSVLSSQLQGSTGAKEPSPLHIVEASSSQFHAENAFQGNEECVEPSVDRTHHTGFQWNLIFGNVVSGNVNQRLAELGSSPSSDYGSYMSDAGTRLSFSGSESTCYGVPHSNVADSEHALFDGPFRVPLPVDRNPQATKSDRSVHQQLGHEPWTVTDCTSASSQSSGDVAVDMAELGPLELDMFDCDLGNVISDCFSACLDSPPKQSESHVTASSAVHTNVNESTTSSGTQQSSPVVLGPFASATALAPPYLSSPGITSGLATTSGLSSTTSYTFVNPVNPVRAAVVTSCYVNVNSNSQDASTRVPIGKIATQATFGQQNCDGNMRDVSLTPQSSVTGSFTSAPVQSSCQPSLGALPRDNNNNSLSIKFSQTGNRFVPVSARITDFSPEWCYPEGGAKVLITGEWTTEGGSYTCLFDGCSVAADLYQSGVLRCYCPPHDPGLVTLQVACNGFIVSNACVFEYRARDYHVGGASCHDWLTIDSDRLKLAILDRLERLESKLTVNQTGSGAQSSGGPQCLSFEERLVHACEIFQKANSSEKDLPKGEKPFRGMTLLHLSAALGFSKVVCALLKLWRDSDNAVVREEVNPLRKDEFACTPLMWACALGQRSSAHLLLEAQPKALLEPDARGRMPMQLARDRGFLEVVQVIEDFVLTSPQNLCVDDSSDGSLSPMASSCEDLSRPTPPMFSLLASSDSTNEVERSTSPMFVDEHDEEPPMVSRRPTRTLAKTLVQIHSMISEAEQEAELNHRISGRLSPLHENTELVTSGTWNSAVRLRSFSTASSQSSPLTPCSSKSSLSPGSPSFLNSPHSSPGGPDTTEFQEFISSSRKLLERDLSDLALTDREQRELYEAAKIIQNAYRNYKTRRHQQEQEMEAAVLIQSHYRRYKEYIAFKKMTQAALIIQSQYRTYREHERFKKSRRAAAIIQNYFRNYRERRRSSQRRREERFSKRMEARYMQKASKRCKDNM